MSDAPDGKLLVPETVAKLVFGGPKRTHLFLTATTSVYAILTSVNGAPGPWQRRSR